MPIDRIKRWLDSWGPHAEATPRGVKVKDSHLPALTAKAADAGIRGDAPHEADARASVDRARTIDTLATVEAALDSEARERVAREVQRGNILDAPCRYCGYNGAGYWQRSTHHPGCPWHDVGGKDARLSLELAGRIYDEALSGGTEESIHYRIPRLYAEAIATARREADKEWAMKVDDHVERCVERARREAIEDGRREERERHEPLAQALQEFTQMRTDAPGFVREFTLAVMRAGAALRALEDEETLQ